MGSNDDWTSFMPPGAGNPPPSDGPYLPPPSTEPTATEATATEPTATEPTATVVSSPEPPRRSRGKVVGGLVAVVALLGAGGFAVTKIVAGNDGGAGSATEVGTRLMDALGNEDALGVVDLLLPGERETFRQPLLDLVDELKRLEIADSSATLGKIGGLDISFADVQVDAMPTNADDITNVHITATGTVSVDGEQLPIGKLLIDKAFDGERPPIDSAAQQSDLDWKVTTVERDGRWYLSLFYSIAEAARHGRGDIPDQPIVARGADTPEGAVQAAVDAIDTPDLEALIAVLNPNEAEALQRYAPLFLDDAQGALADSGFSVSFSDVKYSVTGSGDRRTVAIDSYKMVASGDSNDVTIEAKPDGCTVVTVQDQTIDTCKGGGTLDAVIKSIGASDSEELRTLVDTARKAFADLEPLGFTVQQIDGKWFLSPIGTYADSLLSILGALDSGELTGIIDAVEKFAESDWFAPDVFGQMDASSSSGSTDASGFDQCYAEADYGAYADCISSGLADGSIDAASVAPYFRFPECGVAEQYFDGSVYTMSDEEFVAFAEAAAPCFQKHVDDGTIFQWELPYELSRPDCLEGKNWYTATDADYNERVFECAT